MDELQELMNSITEWSTNQFGDDQTHQSIVKKLEEEVAELDVATSLDLTAMKIEELADCFHLLLDYSKRMGVTAEDLVKITSAKLARNKIRKWNEPNSDGVIKHIKVDKEIVHDKLCGIVKEAMYREAHNNSTTPNLKATVKKIVELSQRIIRWEDKAEAEHELSQLCILIDSCFPNKLEFARCVLNVDLEKLYIRLYGDPHAKTN